MINFHHEIVLNSNTFEEILSYPQEHYLPYETYEPIPRGGLYLSRNLPYQTVLKINTLL